MAFFMSALLRDGGLYTRGATTSAGRHTSKQSIPRCRRPDDPSHALETRGVSPDARRGRALLLLSPADGRALPSVADPQWLLDIERAMDVAGVAPGLVIGEAGAGDGYFTLPMARRVGPAGLVYANDISTRALRSLEEHAARAELTNIRTVVGDVTIRRFPRRDLQLVVVVHAFHDFSQPVEWLVNRRATFARAGPSLSSTGTRSRAPSRTSGPARASKATRLKPVTSWPRVR